MSLSGLELEPAKWYLEIVPMFMRSWPLIRRYSWQQHEIDAAKQWATEMAEFLEEDKP